MPHRARSPRPTQPTGGALAGDEQDLASTDEIKIYKDEGEDDEQHASENLSEDKLGLVTETEEVNNQTIYILHACDVLSLNKTI